MTKNQRLLNALIAIVLAVGSTGVLAVTDDMGVTRDESFYFKYAEVYQGWFTRVSKQLAGEENNALSRHDVVNTWSQNFEHPPLMKVLFGWSWKALAAKQRALVIENEPDKRLRVRLNSIADGFEPGDTVELLAPLAVGLKTSQSMGWAKVVQNDGKFATLATDIEKQSLIARCKAPISTNRNSPHPWIRGCRAQAPGPMSEISAMRLPTWILSGVLIALIFLMAAEWFSPWAGLFAALSFFFVPRQFFHAHLCTFDMGVTTVIMATLYCFWRSLNSRLWCVFTGVMWGVALLTKLNAFFVPVPLVLWWLSCNPPQLKLQSQAPPKSLHVAMAIITLLLGSALGAVGFLSGCLFWLLLARRNFVLTAMPEAFLWMPPIGISLLFLGWPRLWYDPAYAFSQYVSFHLNHVHYLQNYFGTILSVPPFPMTYPLVMTLLTVPVVLLGCFAVGSVQLWADREQQHSRSMHLFLLFNLLFPIVLISLPKTPIFGGVKHWFVTMAFFAIVAGYGFDALRVRICERLNSGIMRGVAALTIAVTLLLPGTVQSIKYRQFGTSFYNALAGGIRGGADKQLHRQFWGYSGAYGLDWVNQHAPANASVAFHNTTWDAVDWYKRTGLLRSDIRWRRDPPTRCSQKNGIYLFHHQESFAQERLDAWEKLNTWVPEVVVDVEGVPMLSIYRCNEATGPGKT